MITQTLLFLILIIGTFSIAVISRRRFEEIIPFTILGIVGIVFISGLFGNLVVGFYLCIVMIVSFFFYAVLLCIRRKRNVIITETLITPAFVIFILLYGFLMPFNRGRVSHNWDEFSFWNSVVKIMTIWNKFGTYKEADLLSAMYPPGMACFQYFVEKLHFVANHTNYIDFSEWRLFFSYQLFSYMILFPFLRNLRYKNIWKVALCGGILFTAPSFFTHFFLYLTIDAFLGTLFGVGLAVSFFWTERDAYQKIYVSAICCMLVLTKTIGVFLAVIVAVSYMARILNIEAYHIKIRQNYLVKNFIQISAAILVPYILWNIHVRISGCHLILTNPIDYKDFLQILIGNGDPDKITILKAFISNIFSPVFGIANSGIATTLICAIIILCALFCIIGYRCTGIDNQSELALNYVKTQVMLLIIVSGFVLYTLGMLFMYLYKMIDSTLPSFTRYFDIYLHGIIICIICGLLLILQKCIKCGRIEIILSLVVFLLCPQNTLGEYLTYTEQSYALTRRAKYTEFIERYKMACGGG